MLKIQHLFQLPYKLGRSLGSHRCDRVLMPRSLASDARTVQLNYQQNPDDGLRLGRYIVPPTHYQYDVIDVQIPTLTQLHDGRKLTRPATLDAEGFSLHAWPTTCRDFGDDVEIAQKYYDEMRRLVKDASGASLVLIFDHKLRGPGDALAKPVERVHCDYTEDSAQQQLEQVVENGVFSQMRKRMLNSREGKALLDRPFALINVWRSIDRIACVKSSPLAVCDASSVSPADRLYYEVHFPIYDGHTGENYGLCFNENHRWYHYPDMTIDECLVFKVCDTRVDTPQFVFHTSFQDPLTVPDAPARQSIEVRALAFFGSNGEEQEENDVLHTKLHFRKGKIVKRRSPHE